MPDREDRGAEVTADLSRGGPDATAPFSDAAEVARAGPGTVAPTIGESPGSRIGPYTLVRAIGEGGFGTVFLAEQEKPVKRRVALKIIKLGMDTRQVVARFEQERQTLARMEHPAIARVFDAGATATGRPFFVMELVKGEPITRYCDANNLSIAIRLWLFAQVCDAVQHAHTKGIIHRDIKPGNVLASTQDGRPAVKVIDFGIAKATSARGDERAFVTEQRQLVGTPMYMSPEQAEGSSDIDTRTDIYALGVLLYELLTGTTPFDAETLSSANFAELQRIIRDVEPPTPSTRLAGRGDALAKTAAHRRTDARRLGTLVRGELDWIVMCAIAKDRTRRYESAAALAADVRRHLAGEAVLAAPPSRAYRLSKFVRRNRGAAATVAVVSLAIVLGLVGTIWQALRANAERDHAFQATEREKEARTAAEADRDSVERIATFMSDSLRGAGPSMARGRDITMLKEMMDDSAASIERGDLRGSPAAELRLRQTIGSTYRELALYDDAARMLEPAVDLARSLHPGDHATTAAALRDVGVLLQARGEMAAAEAPLRASLDMQRRLQQGDHQTIADSLAALGELLLARGDVTGAEAPLRDALEMNRRLHSGDHECVARSLGGVAAWHRAHRDLAEAGSHSRESLLMYRRLHAGDHPDVASALHTMALQLRGTRDVEEAESMLVESLEMYRRLLPGDHPLVARGLNSLAFHLQNHGRAAEAEPLLRESVDMYERLFPDDHPEAASAIDNLAYQQSQNGDWEGAVESARNAVTMYVKTQGEDAGATGSARLRLGHALHVLGRFTEAEPELIEAERVLSKAEGLPPARYRMSLEALLRFYAAWNRMEPGAGHDAQQAAWRAKLDAWREANPSLGGRQDRARKDEARPDGTKPDGARPGGRPGRGEDRDGDGEPDRRRDRPRRVSDATSAAPILPAL